MSPPNEPPSDHDSTRSGPPREDGEPPDWRDALRARWGELLAEASAAKPGHSAFEAAQVSEAPLELLGLAVVLWVTSQLETIPLEQRRMALQRGRRALLAADASDEDTAFAVAIAREGLKALEGRHDLSPQGGDPMAPSPSRLLSMLRGRPDGLSAGACALRAAVDEGARQQLGLLTSLRPAEPTASVTSGASKPAFVLAAAASSSAPMRDPAEGRLVATLRSPGVEAVFFEDGWLAIYSESEEPLRLESESLTTQQMLPGYWAGRVAPGLTRVDVELIVGDERRPWSLQLS